MLSEEICQLMFGMNLYFKKTFYKQVKNITALLSCEAVTTLI